MSLLVVPMRAYGRPVGTLSITWRGAGREAPDAEVVALVEALAGHACFALANARQFATGRALRYQAGRAGEAQRTAEARFHQLIATTGESVWMLDGEQRITFANGRTAMLLGHDDPSELIGLHRDTFVFPEDRAAAAGRHAVRRAGVSGRDETRLRRRDGSEVWVLIEATPLHDADGRFEGVLAMAMDVTERRCGQEALRASEERFRELAESIREVFWLSDVVGRQMIYVSPAYEVIWGRPCTPVQAVPREWAASLHPDDRERVVRASRALHLAGDYDLEYRIVRPDGAVRWIHDKAFPVRDASGRVVRVAGVAEDVTERRELEAQFRQAQKMEAVGRLAGGVAHDFNNVLSVISGYADLVSGDLLPGDPMFEDVGQIQRAAARAAGLTRQLLAFSRQQVLEPRALDLAEVVLDMEKLMLRLLGEDIVLSLAAVPGAGAVRGRPGAGRAGHHEPGGQRARRDARRRPAHHRDVGHRARRGLRRAAHRRGAGSVRGALRGRQRAGHGRGHAGADLRALLHDQGPGEGHGARALDRVRDREAVGRPRLGGERGRPRSDLHGVLPAGGLAGERGDGGVPRGDARPGLGDRARGRGTSRRCARWCAASSGAAAITSSTPPTRARPC
jgi:PAS domain S-box-containing protein